MFNTISEAVKYVEDESKRKDIISFQLPYKNTFHTIEIITPLTFQGGGLKALEFYNDLTDIFERYKRGVESSEARSFSINGLDYIDYIDKKKEHLEKYMKYVVNLAECMEKKVNYIGEYVPLDYIDTFDNEKKSLYYSTIKMVDYDAKNAYMEAYTLIKDTILKVNWKDIDWEYWDCVKVHKDMVMLYNTVWNAFFTEASQNAGSKEKENPQDLKSQPSSDLK